MDAFLTKSKKGLPLNPEVVEEIARDYSLRAQKGEDVIIFTEHADEQMDERNISKKQVLQVLEFGRFVKGQERFSEEENDYSYLLRDHYVDDRDIAVAIAIIDADGQKVLIVTAMIIDPQTGKFI